jgi:multiple sugar transport system substrate-binding protein
MTIKSNNSKGGRDVGRRTALKTIGSAAALVAGASATGHWKRSFAQSKKSVRVWTTQVAPDQLKGYDYYKESFEEAHPGIEIEWEHVSDDDAWPKLIAAYAGGNPPEIVSNLTPSWNATLYAQKKLVMMNDVAEAVGLDDWDQAALKIHSAPNGDQYGLPIGSNAFATMWHRRDLMAKAGVKAPKDWAASVPFFKALTKGGIYGHSNPYAAGGMTNTLGWAFIKKSGGDIVNPDQTTSMESGPIVDALEFVKEIRPYSPSGATGYSYGESLGAFVSGRSATGWYTGRALMNVNTQNPKIMDDVGAVPWPSKDSNNAFDMGGYHAHWICKGCKNPKEAATVAAWHYSGTGSQGSVYAKWLHGAPSHLLPILKSTAASDDYWNHPLLKRKKAEVLVMIEMLKNGYTRVKEGPDHPINFKMGEIMGTNVFALMTQKVVVNNENPKTVAEWGRDQVAKVMEG